MLTCFKCGFTIVSMKNVFVIINIYILGIQKITFTTLRSDQSLLCQEHD